MKDERDIDDIIRESLTALMMPSESYKKFDRKYWDSFIESTTTFQHWCRFKRFHEVYALYEEACAAVEATLALRKL